MAQIRWTPPFLAYTRRKQRVIISLSPPSAPTYSETLTTATVIISSNTISDSYQAAGAGGGAKNRLLLGVG